MSKLLLKGFKHQGHLFDNILLLLFNWFYHIGLHWSIDTISDNNFDNVLIIPSIMPNIYRFKIGPYHMIQQKQKCCFWSAIQTQ